MNRILIVMMLISSLAFGQTATESASQIAYDGQGAERSQRKGRIEPNAGKWRTWVIPSGRDYRVAAPPSRWETKVEARQVAELVSQNDDAAKQQIAYWDAGAPAYRWMDLINARVMAATPTTAYPHRVYAYVALAMYDATVATWESKYHYHRQRPSEMDARVKPVLEVPDSPSYPSEHAATAQAAALVLAHFLPNERGAFQTMAEEASWSRVRAGLQYPSAHYAGLELGKKVAEAVIAKANMDGAAQPWRGTVPTGPCKWVGANPGTVGLRWC